MRVKSGSPMFRTACNGYIESDPKATSQTRLFGDSIRKKAATTLRHGATKDQGCILPRMPFKCQGEHPENPVSLITGTPARFVPGQYQVYMALKKSKSFGYSIWTKLNMVVWLGTEFKNSP